MIARQNPAAVVHVIDDDAAALRGIALLLRAARIPVVAHASAQAFLDSLPHGMEAPGVGCVLTDLRMPDLDGLALLHRLRLRGFRPPVLVMTAHGDVAMAVQAMKAGASDFIEKPFDEATLLGSVEAALAALETRPAGTAAARRGTGPMAAAQAAARIAMLSPRERAVLDLLMAGKANKVAAQELGLSPRTVEAHRARLMLRLGVRSLAEAARMALLAERIGAGGGPPGRPTAA